MENEKIEANKRILELKKVIDYHRYLYHVKDKQEISEGALDSLKHELKTLEERYPEFLTLDSPSQRVGGAPLDKFNKIKHQIAQWSFDDAFDESEIREFDDRIKRGLLKFYKRDIIPAYTCELKIDGLKIVLTYEGGILVSAATRGDGEFGEDVTENVKTIESIPLRLEEGVDVIAEGEIWMSKSEFDRLNEEQLKLGKSVYANPRNVAAGTIRQLDPRIVGKRHLDSFIYDMPKSHKDPRTQIEELKILEKLGFKVNKNYEYCGDIEKVIKYWQKWKMHRDKEEYWLDGIVVKVNEVEYQKALGYTGKSPRFAVAFKFPAEQVTTIVDDIQIQVGRTGVLTPVAHLRPVSVAGSLVSRATLHNQDEIKRLDVRVGDTAIIEKAGDIIPAVIQVLLELRPKNSQPFNFPIFCPICKSKVIRVDGEVAFRCPSKKCFAQMLRGLHHFVSRKAMNIDGLGPKLLDRFVSEGLISTPADIFELKRGDIESLSGLGQKSAENIIFAIEEAKKRELYRFIFALGIPHVGEETAIELANNLGSFGALLGASSSRLTEVDGVGPVVAESVSNYFRDKMNQELIRHLLTHLNLINPERNKLVKTKRGKLAGKTFVLTGTLHNLTRDEAKTLIRNAGGEISSSISTKIDYLLVGESPGSKFIKAKELGIKVIGEDDFSMLI